MDISKAEAQFILEAVYLAPIQTNVKGLMGDTKVSPLVENLIIKLKSMLDENTEATGAAPVETPEAEPAQEPA